MHMKCTANDLDPSYMTLTKYINFLSLVAIKILICKMSVEYKGVSNFYKNLRYHIFIAKKLGKIKLIYLISIALIR